MAFARATLPATVVAWASLGWTACAPRFFGADIEEIVRARSATWFVTGVSSYSVYAGYGSPCAHPGAHANFSTPSFGTNLGVVAPLDAMVSRVTRCAIATSGGVSHDKYEIALLIGMKGAVPVHLELSFEPFGGEQCSGPLNDSEYFRREKIVVNEGQRVSRGEVFAIFTPIADGAHIHFNLKADGATICPEIFSSFGGAAAASSTCGSDPIATGTLCHALTESEDPSRLLR